MSRNVEYEFFPADEETLVAELAADYERRMGVRVQPASVDKLLIQWAAHALLLERVRANHIGNQNLPSRAEGKNLDALAELFGEPERPDAQAAVCTERFFLSAAQQTAILVPKGTRVTDGSGGLVWETTEDAYIAIGETSVDVPIRCQTPGAVGNGYAPGQIGTAIDIINYFERCENITESAAGADTATDDEYYDLLRASQDAVSTAGPRGGYEYIAKQVSTEIADVVANRPEAGQVALYVLMADGTPAQEEVKNAVAAACSEKDKRPLTDSVTVGDPEVVEYELSLRYYIPGNSSLSSAAIEEAVETAVEEYTAWQCARLGRDINPSQLISLLMQTGVKRVEVLSPTYQALRDGGDNSAPQVASVHGKTITNGGFEDE